MNANPYVGAYPFLPERQGIWREIVRYVARDAPGAERVLELGAGYCDFINLFPARRKLAFDLNPEMRRHAAPDVDLRIADGTTLPGLEARSLDLVFASNFLEHFAEPQLSTLLKSVHRVLRPGGRLVLLQPNYRRCPERYFDDPTHQTIFHDANITPLLERHGLRVCKVVPGLLPFSMKSRGPKWPWLVRLYLNAPLRPRAAQMYVVAERGRTIWKGKTVSLLLPTFNERDSIRQSIDEFEAAGVVDEIIVVNNNAAPGTSEEVAHTTAREVHESRQGYGAAIRRGFHEASGDLIVVSEPDGTFRGHDLLKLLAYADDFEVVYGSRTVKELIWKGANMGLFLKWGNYWVAKLMELLFNSTSLTDVGCTMRCIRRSALRDLEPYFTVDGSFFGPQMMVLSILLKMKMIQIPVNYTRRVGTSSVTGNHLVAFFLGLRMIRLILGYRFGSWLHRGKFRRRSGRHDTREVELLVTPLPHQEEEPPRSVDGRR